MIGGPDLNVHMWVVFVLEYHDSASGFLRF